MTREEKLAEQKRRRLALQDSYRAIFDLPDGKNVLKHLCKTYHVGTETFVPGSPDLSAYKQGQRSVVLAILRFINRNQEIIIQQLEEQYQNERSIF